MLRPELFTLRTRAVDRLNSQAHTHRRGSGRTDGFDGWAAGVVNKASRRAVAGARLQHGIRHHDIRPPTTMMRRRLLLLALVAVAVVPSQGFIVPPPLSSSSSRSPACGVSHLGATAAAAVATPSNASVPAARPPKRKGGRRGGYADSGGGRRATPVIEFSMRRAGDTPAIDLLEAALEGGTPPGECEEGLFAAALRECRAVGDGKRALRYLGLAPEAQLTEMDFANAIHACAASSAQGNSGGGGARGGALLVQEAVGALRRLQGLATARAGPRCYAAAMVTCSRGGKPEEARRLFEEMDGRDGRPAPDAVCVAAMMETYRRQGQAQQALDLLLRHEGVGEENRSPGPRPPGHHLTLAAVVRVLSDLGRAAEGVALFEAARVGGRASYLVDGGCYAAALDSLADMGDAEGARALLEAMYAEGEMGAVRRRGRLRVGRQHYVSVLRACAKAGAWGLAQGVLDEMRVRPDEKCFRWALFAACAAGEGEEAAAMLRGREDVPWSLPCYTTAMRALAKEGRWEAVLALWDLLLARGLAPDAATGDVAVSAAGAGKLWARAEAVFGEMRRRGVEPREPAYGVVIEGRCQRGKVGEALALLRRVRRANVVMYTSVLCALGRQGRVPQALALLQEMEGQKGIAPDQVALTSVVDACLKAGAVDDAARLALRLEEAAAAQSSDDELSVGVRVRALLEQGQWAAARQSVLNAEARGLASHLSYSLLINAAAREGRWRDAVGVLLHMRERGVAVSALDNSSAINACRLGGELEAAMALLRVLDARRRREQRREGEGGGSGGPYQASCGLVLDLLAKKVPPVRGAAKKGKRQWPWHRPPPGSGGQGQNVEEKKEGEKTVRPRGRPRKAPPSPPKKRRSGGREGKEPSVR